MAVLAGVYGILAPLSGWCRLQLITMLAEQHLPCLCGHVNLND